MPKTTVNDIELYYEERGEGPPLLMVHGLGTSSVDWEYQYPALTQQYRVIAPDQRGFGQSTRPAGPYSVKQYVDDLRALLDHLGIERAHTCGISMGGAVLFQLATDYPERLRSLAVINSQPSFVLDNWKKRFMVLTRTLMARYLGMGLEGRIQLYRNFPGPHNRELRRRLRGRFNNDIEPYMAAIDAVAGWTVVDRLDRITAPVMFLIGEHDFTPPEEKAHFADMIADARVVVLEGARHAMHLERAEAVNTALLEFFQEIDSRS